MVSLSERASLLERASLVDMASLLEMSSLLESLLGSLMEKSSLMSPTVCGYQTLKMKAMKNYAGSRLSPWLGHLMVSRSETARPLLTPGEVMQLPPTDEIVMVSGVHPIRAKKARYYEDPQFRARILPPPAAPSGRPEGAPIDDWTGRAPIEPAPPRRRRPVAGRRPPPRSRKASNLKATARRRMRQSRLNPHDGTQI
jgi:hypothetical protein